MSDPLFRFLYRWRVRAGILSAVLALIFADPETKSLIGGIILSSIGLILRAWSSGHIRKEKELTVSGPYRYTRNPLYLGNLFMGIGIAVAAWSWWVLGLVVLYFLLFYPAVIYIEREKMQALFPEEYMNYFHKVPLFFPRLSPAFRGGQKFSWKRYLKNREIRALAGMGLFWVLLVAKMFLMN